MHGGEIFFIETALCLQATNSVLNLDENRCICPR